MNDSYSWCGIDSSQVNPHRFGWSFGFGGFRLQKLMQTTKVHGRELRGAKIPPIKNVEGKVQFKNSCC